MGEGIVYCHTCGIKITSSEFKKSRAITLLGRSYCQKCATKDIIKEAAKQEKEQTPDPTRPTTRVERKRRTEPTRRQAPRRKYSRLSLIVGVIVAVIVVILIILVLVSGTD